MKKNRQSARNVKLDKVRLQVSNVRASLSSKTYISLNVNPTQSCQLNVTFLRTRVIPCLLSENSDADSHPDAVLFRQ
jgi:hypothetical protein